EKLNKDSNVAVIGTTNRLDQIDTAVVRPGRIEKSVKFENPSRDVIKRILETKLKEFHIEGGATEVEFARDCMSLFAKPGTSGATAARVVEIAISNAQKEKNTKMLSEITITAAHMRAAASSLGLC
ncbi:MAG: AAA family ATPase, partial [Clostridia bacterium]|nr:AAA family ATPase [Clostridia bacterium]